MEKQRAERWRVFFFHRFLPQCWGDIRASVAEQVVGVILAILILIAQIHYGLITKDAVRANVLAISWPYIILVGMFIVYHFLRAPWLVSNRHLDTHSDLKGDLAKAERDHEATKQQLTMERERNKKPSFTGLLTAVFAAIPKFIDKSGKEHFKTYDSLVAVRFEAWNTVDMTLTSVRDASLKIEVDGVVYQGRRDKDVPVSSATLEMPGGNLYVISTHDKCRPLAYLARTEETLLFYVEGLSFKSVSQVDVTLTLSDLCNQQTHLHYPKAVFDTQTLAVRI
jgi:hypothetical protein